METRDLVTAFPLMAHSFDDPDRQEPRASGSLLAFFSLTFLVTWTCFWGAVAASRGRPPASEMSFGPRALVLIGTFAPALVAVALTARAAGRPGLRPLLAPLFAWRVPARWYVFALTYFIAVKLAAAAALRILTGSWPRFADASWLVIAPAAVLLSTGIGGQSGEEVGWRGYALPRLTRRWGLVSASLVLGVIWALWHLPLFYLKGADTYGQSFPVYLADVVAFSVVFAWVWWRTGRSLLLTMLLHASINNTGGIVPSVPMPPVNPFVVRASPLSWLVLAMLWLVAAFVLTRLRGEPRDSALTVVANSISGVPPHVRC